MDPNLQPPSAEPDKARSPNETAPPSIQITAESTPAEDNRALKEAMLVFLIKIHIRKAWLREIHKLSPSVGAEPEEDNFPVIVRLEFSGDEFEEHAINKFDHDIQLSQNRRKELTRILFYSEKRGMLALRKYRPDNSPNTNSHGSSPNIEDVFKSVLCFPLTRDSISAQFIDFDLEAAI